MKAAPNLLSTLRQAIACIMRETFIDGGPECFDAIDSAVAKIIDTDVKGDTQCITEVFLNGLWCHLDLEEQLLLEIAAAIRGIPVAIVVLPAALLPRHTPMGKFVQRAARVVLREPDFGRFLGAACLVERFVKAADQACVVGR